MEEVGTVKEIETAASEMNVKTVQTEHVRTKYSKSSTTPISDSIVTRSSRQFNILPVTISAVLVVLVIAGLFVIILVIILVIRCKHSKSHVEGAIKYSNEIGFGKLTHCSILD